MLAQYGSLHGRKACCMCQLLASVLLTH
jgi:hypothetical protein